MEMNLTTKERIALHSIKKYYWDNYTAIAIDECELLERLVKLFAIPCVSGSASPKKCKDCGKEDESVKTRPSGYGLQCYECYKIDMNHDNGNW